MKKGKLVKTVKLVFFEDDANGEYGLTHKETVCDNGFNAFWNGTGIFHDVFEHSHEFTHKYFMGDYALNVVGEMVAMGAAAYYYDVLNVYNRPLNDRYYFIDSVRRSTEDMLQESIANGYTNYGDTLKSCIPRQNPTDNGELESMLDTYCENVKGFNITTDDVDEIERARNFKKSVTEVIIKNSHRFGYRMGQKLIPDNWYNREQLFQFIKGFNEFTKNNSAEELTNTFYGITFNIYKDREGKINWEGILETRYRGEIEDIILTDRNVNDIIVMDELMPIEEAY